ncbi:hypothetical protein BX264_3163 [Streptomyces sp. 2333.5]|uniref:hypothetical protein n=1 Tax=Streptomyces TaxID=1883 RepID=UPI00089C561F|nr:MULTISPECIES: hypothetical protein [unclassified Streptomyces]PJJ02811.1 hypothetical protein BX264_3163 [Streptomyces sp. 2333.5]SED28247.1 hypothetical protein SAMN05428943_3303 [Streptomyces sp. 2314.4]SEE15849.1 hypothetical protein SAMN05428942_3267 [Streptomyces sp. 2112.2]
MDGIGDDGFDGEDLDPDAVLWVRGVDYLAGWRDATQAAAELGEALSAAGLDTTEAKLRAAAVSDGSGVVRLELSAAAAREVAVRARAATAQWRDVS